MGKRITITITVTAAASGVSSAKHELLGACAVGPTRQAVRFVRAAMTDPTRRPAVPEGPR